MAVLAFFLITRIVPLSAEDRGRYAEFPFGGMNSRLARLRGLGPFFVFGPLNINGLG
jgi:hypothetical protein